MQAVIAMRNSQLMASYIAGKGGDLEIYDVFPFWSEEEKKDLLIEKWKKVMYNEVSKKGG